ncbi:hypothetical protein RRG08_027302 [Elysia crispata]|uniref:Uncharacterized protein n=1 Tax=Elysia crispata TaxID=231223 RepID=A0AAE1EBH9_9GAST|nr:hypothetical protein RRG08_027302 [Elysia crispata]
MNRRNGVRGRCTNWQTGRKAEKRGDQETETRNQRQGTRGKTRPEMGRKRRKKERYRQEGRKKRLTICSPLAIISSGALSESPSPPRVERSG